ncbi:MAG: methyltransferase domain-containing protein [Rhodopila sp.]
MCAHAAALIDAGRITVARPLLAAARSMAPPSPQLTILSARLAVGEGALEQARAELDGAIEALSMQPDLRKCRADVRSRLDDPEGAARDAAEAVILNPADPQAKAILGGTMLNLGRAADAAACLAEALAAHPREPVWRETLAIALQALGDADTALAVLTDGIALLPGNVVLRNAAILLCLRHRDFTEAHRLAEQARQQGIADACTFGMKGHALSSLGRHEEAAAAYQEAYKLGPNDPYVRHLVVASGALPDANRAPESYIRAVFDGYANQFEAHLISLGYSIPGAIRKALLAHPKVAAGLPVGPVLDLGCGTGLAVVAINDLPLGPFTGVDLARRMLDHARAKQIYDELREADVMADLAAQTQYWPLILAADMLCYFGALDEFLPLVQARLTPGGWFVFSVEELLPDRNGTVPGNGRWALQRLGRYAHAADYVHEAAIAAGFRVLRTDRLVARQENGVPVPGIVVTLETLRHDD